MQRQYDTHNDVVVDDVDEDDNVEEEHVADMMTATGMTATGMKMGRTGTQVMIEAEAMVTQSTLIQCGNLVMHLVSVLWRKKVLLWM